MNSDQEIFLKLSPKCDIFSDSKEYHFYSNQNNEIYKTKNIYRPYDPAIDSTFKYLFQDVKMLEDMLNSLLFPEYPQLSVEAILDKEIVRPNELYCKGTIRSDLVCKARLNEETIIFGIEMQIGVDGDFSKRLFQYSVGLSNKYKYENSWMNAFFINTNKQPKYSKSIKLMENKNGEENELDFIKIIEIDLREEIKKINNDEDVFINGKKLDKKGKEWLKLLGLRTWCPREDEQFILPKGYILSSNSFLNQAIETLEDMPVFIGIDALNFERDKKKYDKKIEDMVKKGEKRGKKKGLIEGRKEGLEEGMQKGLQKGRQEGLQKGLQKGEIISNIKIAFKFFKDREKDEILLKILGDNYYHSNDVFDCLDKEDENLVVDFILFLNKNHIFIVDK